MEQDGQRAALEQTAGGLCVPQRACVCVCFSGGFFFFLVVFPTFRGSEKKVSSSTGAIITSTDL